MGNVTAPSIPGEAVRQGKALYETTLRANLEPEHSGKYLIIETDTGTYEMLDSWSSLTMRLHELGMSNTRYIMQIGSPSLFRKGGAWSDTQNDRG